MVIDADANGRVTLAADDIIVAVVLRNYLKMQGSAEDDPALAKVRPTNTTAWINVDRNASADAPSLEELERPKVILLQNGPQGGFTQSARLEAGNHLVSDNVRSVIVSNR